MKLEDKLLQDLKSECVYIQATEDELKDWSYGDEGYREDTEYDLKVSQNVKEYLEGVLGLTYVWSKDKEDWLQLKLDN